MATVSLLAMLDRKADKMSDQMRQIVRRIICQRDSLPASVGVKVQRWLVLL